METIPGVQKLGAVRISSLNQVGENVKYDKRTKSLVLSRAGSIFDLLVHIDAQEGLFDFRDAPFLTVSFRLNDQYLSIDLETRRAVLAEPIKRNEIPRSAIFQYQRRKFDRSSASVAYLYEEQELWLRHSNSRLRFDSQGSGASFGLDASFMFRPLRMSKPDVDDPDENVKPSRENVSREFSEHSEVPVELLDAMKSRIDRIMEMVNMNDRFLNSKKQKTTP